VTILPIKNPIRFALINIVIVLVVGLLCFFVLTLNNASLFPISHVKVIGDYSHVDRAEVEQIVKPLVQKSFFATDLASIQHQLLTISWLETVAVQRVWPNKIVITLKERTPLAVWNDNHLITNDGVMFSTKHGEFVSTLPAFIGPNDSQALMMEKYAHFSDILLPIGLHIKQLRLTSSMVWSLRLDSGTELTLGDKDMFERLERFVKVYPTLFAKKHSRAKHIDLRYGDGVAVRWR
jgi:cell division protein FtsQ